MPQLAAIYSPRDKSPGVRLLVITPGRQPRLSGVTPESPVIYFTKHPELELTGIRFYEGSLIRFYSGEPIQFYEA